MELASLFIRYVGKEEYYEDIEFIIKEYIIWHANTDSILPIWSPESFVEFFIHEAADIEDEETVGIQKCMEELKPQIKEHIYDCIEKLKKEIEGPEEFKCNNKFFLQVLIDYIIHHILLNKD